MNATILQFPHRQRGGITEQALLEWLAANVALALFILEAALTFLRMFAAAVKFSI